MTVEELFEDNFVEPDSDTERTCGTCGKHKPFSEFYKDGFDRHGKPKFRRDCKECYRIQRLHDRNLKKKAVKQPQKKGRRR
jgi:hypothetical protein